MVFATPWPPRLSGSAKARRRSASSSATGLRLADAGEAILADPERFSIHLDDRPDDARRIRSSVALLNTALGRDDASTRRERHQSLSEDEETAERLSQRRGIKP